MKETSDYDRIHFECPLCGSRSTFTVYSAYQSDIDFTVDESPLEAILEMKNASEKGRFQCFACREYLLLKVKYQAEVVPFRSNSLKRKKKH